MFLNQNFGSNEWDIVTPWLYKNREKLNQVNSNQVVSRSNQPSSSQALHNSTISSENGIQTSTILSIVTKT